MRELAEGWDVFFVVVEHSHFEWKVVKVTSKFQI